LAEFHQIYSFDAIADNDELSGFWGQRSRSRSNKVKRFRHRHWWTFCWVLSSVWIRACLCV